MSWLKNLFNAPTSSGSTSTPTPEPTVDSVNTQTSTTPFIRTPPPPPGPGKSIHEYHLKILVVGSPQSGKTSFVKRYLKEDIPTNYNPTIGIEINSHPISTKSNKKEFQIPIRAYFWDVPHAEYTSNLEKIFEDVHGVIILFDLTNIKSIQSVDQWRSKIPINLKVLLVGNKSDKRNHVLQPSQLDAYVKSAKIIGWFSTCCLNNDHNINEAVDFLIDSILIGMLKKYNGLPLERIKMIKIESNQNDISTDDMNFRRYSEIEEYDNYTITDNSDTETDNFLDGVEESIEMSNIAFESDKSLQEITSFIEEINQFYWIIFCRLKEYEKIEQFDEIHTHFLSCVYFNLKEDFDFYSKKLDSIYENYLNLREHSMFRNFIQVKREFSTTQIEKWKDFWNDLKLELKLNTFGFKSKQNLISINKEFSSTNKFEIEQKETKLKIKIQELDEKILEEEEIYPSLKNTILVKVHNDEEKKIETNLFFDSIGQEI